MELQTWGFRHLDQDARVARGHKGAFIEEMLKAFRNFLGYWLGFSVLFTVLSLWPSPPSNRKIPIQYLAPLRQICSR